jgi:hypothetical protein
MTDLDRKIAELKGWEVIGTAHPDLHGHPDPLSVPAAGLMGKKDGEVRALAFWSTSDAKALELVDELGMQFRLEGNPGHWSAVFDVYGQHHIDGGTTRPEAICRAYIAAREWLKATAATPPPAPPPTP